MEYVQMTLDDWIQRKTEMRQQLMNIKQSFIVLGYMLRKTEDDESYKMDGYKSVAEFAEKEMGMSPDTVSKLMKLNRYYSEGGYSRILAEEYRDYNRSLLEEMFNLSDKERKMIEPDTKRENVRELNRFNKAEPKQGEADSLPKVLEEFFKENPEILNAVFSEDLENTRKIAELINPGGNRSYRKGRYFLMLYENKVILKEFGKDMQEMRWEDLIGVIKEIFGDAADGDRTWQNYFGESLDLKEKEDAGQKAKNEAGEDENFAPTKNQQTLGNPRCGGHSESAGKKEEMQSPKPEKVLPKQEKVLSESEKALPKPEKVLSESEKVLPEPEKMPTEPEKPMQKKENPAAGNPTEEPEGIAPAKNPQTLGKTGSGEGFESAEDSGITRDIKEGSEENPEGQQETVERAYQSRNEYYSSLNRDEKSSYMASAIAGLMGWIEEKGIRIITTEEFWEMFWDEEVDETGREIEEA